VTCLALHGTGPRNDREPTVTRHGPARVIRCSVPGSSFGPIDDDEVTQVDGVPVPFEVSTTPIHVLAVEGGHVFWGRAS